MVLLFFFKKICVNIWLKCWALWIFFLECPPCFSSANYDYFVPYNSARFSSASSKKLSLPPSLYWGSWHQHPRSFLMYSITSGTHPPKHSLEHHRFQHHAPTVASSAVQFWGWKPPQRERKTASVGGSPAVVKGGCGSPQGQGHWQQKSWEGLVGVSPPGVHH